MAFQIDLPRKYFNDYSMERTRLFKSSIQLEEIGSFEMIYQSYNAVGIFSKIFVIIFYDD